MKRKSLIHLLFFVVATAMASFLSLSAEEPQPPVNPLWKRIRPMQNIVIEPGDEVFISTNIEQDPFDGIYKVDAKGMVRPRYCDKPVKIGGLTELEASKIVLQHTDDCEVFNAKSFVRTNVIKANRLPNR